MKVFVTHLCPVLYCRLFSFFVWCFVLKGLPNEVEWRDAHEKAYRTLKKMTVTKPVLRLPDITKPFIASNTGIGAVLLQDHDGQLFPVSYASKKLLKREQSFSKIEKECFAIDWAIKKLMLCLMEPSLLYRQTISH